MRSHGSAESLRTDTELSIAKKPSAVSVPTHHYVEALSRSQGRARHWAWTSKHPTPAYPLLRRWKHRNNGKWSTRATRGRSTITQFQYRSGWEVDIITSTLWHCVTGSSQMAFDGQSFRLGIAPSTQPRLCRYVVVDHTRNFGARISTTLPEDRAWCGGYQTCVGLYETLFRRR